MRKFQNVGTKSAFTPKINNKDYFILLWKQKINLGKGTLGWHIIFPLGACPSCPIFKTITKYPILAQLVQFFIN